MRKIIIAACLWVIPAHAQTRTDTYDAYGNYTGTVMQFNDGHTMQYDANGGYVGSSRTERENNRSFSIPMCAVFEDC